MQLLRRSGWNGWIVLIGLIVLAPSAQGQHSPPMEDKGSIGKSAAPWSGSIPIEIPPGRNGPTPQLSLIYNPSAGNGFLGAGWDLPIGNIMRRTQDGVDYTCDPLTSPTPCFVLNMGGVSSEIIHREDLCRGCYGVKER